VNRKPKPKPQSEAMSSAKIPFSNTAKDKGLSALLSDLHAAPTQGLIIKSKQKQTPANSQTKTATGSGASEKMGTAFLSSTTTTTSTKTTSKSVTEPKQEGVRDVHSQCHSSVSSSSSVSSLLPVETSKAAPSLTRVAAPRPAAPVRRPVVSAAPPVAPKAVPASQQSQQQQPVPLPAYPTASALQTETHSDTTMNTQQSRKRSRKELERALRQGNMDICNDRADGLQVQSMQQAQPDAYQAQDQAYAAAAASQHGVKNTATAMYDPSAGQAVLVGTAEGVKRSSGTNQINQLMASAANLEQQRSQGIGGAAANNQAGKTHRANAKHKYGW
jgi:hypothetical protein